MLIKENGKLKYSGEITFNTRAAILSNTGDESRFERLIRQFIFFSSTGLTNIDFALGHSSFTVSSDYNESHHRQFGYSR